MTQGRSGAAPGRAGEGSGGLLLLGGGCLAGAVLEGILAGSLGHALDPPGSAAHVCIAAASSLALGLPGLWIGRGGARGAALGLGLSALVWAPEALRVTPVSSPALWGLPIAALLVGLAWRWPRVGLVLACLGFGARPLLRAAFEPSVHPRPALSPALSSEEPSPPPEATGPDIVLITVDTVRADAGLVEALQGPWRRYTSAIAPAPWTLPSVRSVLSGWPVRAHGGGLPVEGGYTGPVDAMPWLPETLGQAGYQTMAVVCNPHLRAGDGFERGFQTWLHQDRAREPLFWMGVVEHLRRRSLGGVDRVARTRDPRILDAALAWLALPSQRPRFLWVHLLGPHEYARHAEDPPAGWSPGTRAAEPLRAAYAGNVAAAARRVQALADAAPDAIVAVTSDHGEALGEAGRWGHGQVLDEAELRVPLALRGPGIPPADVHFAVALTELAPSLLALSRGAPGQAPLLLGHEGRPVEVGGLRRDPDGFALRGPDGLYRAQPAGARGRGRRLDADTVEALEALGYMN